jgi:phosphatidylserine decarboxylase
MFKLAREGYPFIIPCAVAAILTGFFAEPLYLTAIPAALTLFMLYFFRDPDRTTIEGSGLVYAPADGRVILVRETVEDEVLHESAIEVSIFMSAFDVHVNRSPSEGVVRKVEYYPGRFLAAFREGASKANEHITMLLENDRFKLVVRQVAGLMARRAVCRAKRGDKLRQGERYGIIKFSSRVDVFLPLNSQVKVKLHDKVRAGETVLGIIE